jgi:hypothetical protein
MTATIRTLSDYSEKARHDKATYTDYIDIQRYIADIEESYKENIYNIDQYEILIRYAFMVKKELKKAI